MKRFLCILICLMLVVPAAMAESYTPTKLFRQQFITGGNGLRGTVSLTASGVAEWVELLLPFTASDLQVRIIGEKQGAETSLVSDDDDWQMKLYAKDAQGEQKAVTWLYGGPEAVYLQSELLPDTLLTLPVKGVHIPYQLTDGDLTGLLTGFDPLSLLRGDQEGNATAYSALSELTQMSEEEWAEKWEPVLEKYYTMLDMWLAEYASATVVSGSVGSMTMRTSYDIPAEDVKAEAKALIGQMVYDYDLQNLLAPYFTAEQRSLYLNPALVYFYEFCIDAVPLQGSIILEREMSAMGETISMNVSMPLPQLPAELTAPLGEMLAEMFALPCKDIFAGLERISISQSGGDVSLSVSSPQRTISFIIDESAENAETVHWEGFVRITPAVSSDEPPLSAAFTYKSSRKLWEDEEYNTHEDFSWLLSVAPDLSLMEEDDPFRSRYVDFPALSLSAEIGYIKSYKANAPVQLTIEAHAVLPEAEVGLSASLKVAERWEHEAMPTSGAENLMTMSAERIEAVRSTIITNAVKTMSTMNAVPEATETATEPAATETPAVEETPVPPML